MNFETNILANVIINHYFNDSNCLIILANKSNPFYYKGDSPCIYINVDGVSIPRHLIFNCHGCQGIIVVNEDPVGIFEKLEYEMKLGKERFHHRKYLFLPTRSQADEVLNIFQSPAAKFVANVLAIKLNSIKYSNRFGSEESVFDLYTHKYVGPEGSTEDVIWLDRWYSTNETFMVNANLYPDKLQNQQGRSLKIATFTYKPYSIADPPDGTELLIPLEYARSHNMTVQYIIDEDGQWGQVFNNWTGSGILGNLANDKGDVGLGALYTWEHEYGFFDLSKPSMRSGITCIAPAPRLASGLTTPFKSFSKELWIMTAVSYFLTSLSLLILFSLSTNKKNESKMSNTSKVKLSFGLSGRIFLLQGFQKVPSMQRSKLIFGMSLILSLLLTTIYSSGLSSTMTIPRYYGTIRDIHDFAESGLHWGGTSTAWISSLEADNNYDAVKTVSAFIVENEENLGKRSSQEFAYAVERLQAGNLALGSYITLEAAQRRRLLDEDLYWDFSVLMMRKSSILLPTMNEMIFAVTESGLVYYWEYQTVVRYMDIYVQKAVKESVTSNGQDGTRKKLSLEHVVGAFTIWAIGLVISSCAFIAEIFKKRELNTPFQ
uniref:Ionotropic receptor 4 n=1 Tax=Holotrichia parallela TaxID=93412 RepID=A0A2P9JY87_HOLPA|nr:ionotropic receptor 4 [Holotrichia parallela]